MLDGVKVLDFSVSAVLYRDQVTPMYDKSNGSFGDEMKTAQNKCDLSSLVENRVEKKMTRRGRKCNTLRVGVYARTGFFP